MKQPYDPAILLLGIYPKEMKSLSQRDIYTPMFIIALLTVAKIWKQLKCPLTDERIKKMWHIYAMEYYSAIKRNDIELSAVRCMDLETVIQSKSERKTNTVC